LRGRFSQLYKGLQLLLKYPFTLEMQVMSDFSLIDTRIGQANQRLKTAKMGLQIERRGNKLNLRGTLPPRPDSFRLKSYQQRICLNLPTTPAGLKQAEQAAKVVAAQLIQKTFDWRAYLPIAAGGRLQDLSLLEQLQAFEQHFFMQPDRLADPAATRTTWEKAYAPYLRKLQAIAQAHPRLSLPEAIYGTVQSTPVNSRSRQVCCTALAAFSSFLELKLPTPLQSFWGNYGAAQTARQLPSDAEILAVWSQIPNPAWRFVYGMMATYGLRNHEVFCCDFSNLHTNQTSATIEVLETSKTGYHEVWPFYPEWVEQFALRQGELPPVNTNLTQTTLQRIGQTVTIQFRRYQIPFSPYDLRHAWAVRTIHVGLPDTVAARMMGHSVAIHHRTYHRWLTHRDHQQAVDAALKTIGAQHV